MIRIKEFIDSLSNNIIFCLLDNWNVWYIYAQTSIPESTLSDLVLKQAL